jgi:hypothetical protein
MLTACASSEEKAPMPQTRGMQGMDPKAHEQWAKNPDDPYADCVRDEAAAAQQKEHPMPQTKGMQGMDPKAHEMECPEGYVRRPAPGTHIHKAPGSGS